MSGCRRRATPRGGACRPSPSGWGRRRAIRYVTPPRQSASSRLVVVPCDWPAGAPNAVVGHSQTEPRAKGGSVRRIGLFGGTFDPPHFGHLALAEWAREQLRLDRVLFVPAGAPPHKRARRLSSAAARVAMTRLAVRGNPAFRLSELEVRRR